MSIAFAIQCVRCCATSSRTPACCILSSKIELPRNAHLTVLRLGSASDVFAWAFLDDGEGPLAGLAASPRLSRVSWLPSLLVPEKLTVPFLREAAARFQADLLLVYRTPCRRVDVRTGIVPFSGVATARVETTQAAAEGHDPAGDPGEGGSAGHG